MKYLNLEFIGVCLFFLLFARNGYAQQLSAGSGTADDPYQIRTAQEMNSLRNYLGSDYKNAHFRLMNDINLTELLTGSETGWEPIGNLNTKSFQGKLHGNGHKITGLFINRPGDGYIGLFGYTSGASIDNLGVEIAEGKRVQGRKQVGGLIGDASYETKISSCYVAGSISGVISTGGLVGQLGNQSTIDYCYTTGQVEGTWTQNTETGGLVGTSDGKSIIKNSYSTATVFSPNAGVTGGLIGTNGSDCIITACYFAGNVSSNNGSMTGGLAGANFGEICYSFAAGAVNGRKQTGGLAGRNDHLSASSFGYIHSCYSKGSVFMQTDFSEVGGITPTNTLRGVIRDCYTVGKITTDGRNNKICGITALTIGLDIQNCHFDSETTGVSNGIYNSDNSSYFLPGNTTAEMKQKATFANWDFDNVWGIKEGETYPYFLWEAPKKATLERITLSAGTFLPVFNSGVLDYTVAVPNNTNKISITGIPAYEGAAINDIVDAALVEGNNPFELTVISPDGNTPLTYKITIVRKSGSGIGDIISSPVFVKYQANSISIEGIEKANISVFDVQGRIIYRQTNIGREEKIATSAWSKGIYLISLQSTDNKTTIKWIKQ